MAWGLRRKLFAVLSIVAALHLVTAFKDPHGVFCGDDECYELLGLKRGAEKSEIRKAYRLLSLENHPDKNSMPEAQERFTKVAKAYRVFMDEELSKKYDFFLDHPDAYWLEYGHHWVLKYAAETDVRAVLLGLLVLISILMPGIQYTKYNSAVKYLTIAAQKNLGPKSGGSATTMQLRRDAEALLAERKGATGKGKGGNVKVKQSRKEKEAELAAVIEELVLKVEIKGGCRKPTWEDQPVVILAKSPVTLAMLLWHYAKLVKAQVSKGEITIPEKEYWVQRKLGADTWESLGEAASREAVLEGDVWRGGEPMDEWKEEFLFQGEGVRRRKAGAKGAGKKGKAAGGTGGSTLAAVQADKMKGVLGEGSEVEY
ncbi:unnamed protein product [Discosporangium mesarthrocarpum]